MTTFQGHASRVFSVNYAPDGRTVVTASLDGTAKVWDATLPMETAVFDRHSGNVAYVAFSSDARLLLRSDVYGNQVTMWDVRSRAKLAVLPQARARFSSDGKTLATTTQKRVTLWDVSSDSPRMRATIDLSGSPRFEPILSPDRQRLAIDLGRDSAAVGIFNVATKHQIARLAESSAKLELSGYAASPDGRFFATGIATGG